MRDLVLTLAAASSLLFAAGPSFADAIDGDWCSASGKHLRIDGPRIMIPSGAEITGDYRRHSFRYEAPAGDPDAGERVDMTLLSEEEMLLRRTVGGEMQPVEEWRRCQAVS